MTVIANLTVPPYLQILDDNGVPLSGAKIYTYEAGTNTPKATNTDYDSGISASNPLVADSGGRVAVWLLTDGLYKFVITDSIGNQIYVQDNIGSGSGSGLSLVVNTVVGTTLSLKSLAAGSATSVTCLGYRTVSDEGGGLFRWQTGATGGDNGETVDGNTTYTTGRWKRVIEGDCNPRWWGAYGTGTDDDTTYLTAAITYANSVGKAIKLVNGNYLLSSAVSFGTVPVKFDPKAKFTWTSFSPAMIAIINDVTQHFDCGATSPVFPAGMVVNPRWFGAKGDNNPNDSLPINQAINSVTTNGGVVSIDDGIYYCKDALAPKENVAIVGQGEYTVLKLSSPTGVTNAFVEMETPTYLANRFSISNITLKSDTITAYGALSVAGSDIKIDNCCFDAWAGKAIQIGNNDTPTNIKNISIIHNIIKDSAGGVELQAGQDITVSSNSFINSVYVDGIVINPNSKQGLLNVVVSDNHLTNCTIEARPNSSASNAVGLIITNNKVDGSLLDVGLSVSGTYSVLGQVVVNDNSISLSKADSTGILIEAGTDGVGSYTVNNNSIQADLNKYGIFASGITRPLIVDGNAMTLVGGTGIKETSVTDASYGTNVMIGGADKYDVSQPRYCTLGTNLRSQIDGDTTADTNLIVNGSIINTAYLNLFKTMITGLDTTNGGVNSSKLVVNPGTCTSTGGYMTNLVSSLTKDTTSTWAAGDSSGGMANGITAGDGTGYHFFVIGKTSNPNAVDAGFDTDVNATNLLASPAVVSAGYNTYRRIGYGYRESFYYQLRSFWQKGDFFNYDGVVGADSTNLTGAARTTLTLTAVPKGVSVQARLACRAWTANQALPSNNFYFFDGIGYLNPGYVGVAANHTTTTWDPPPVGANLWTDTSARIGLNSVSTGATPTPVTPCDCEVITLGWMDPRGKY